MADRIGIIHHGLLLQELDVAALESNRRRRLVIQTRDAQAALAVLGSMGFSQTYIVEEKIEVRDASAIQHPDEVATRLVQAGHPPTRLNIEYEDLEHYFLRLIGMDQEREP
jgi:ABC-2 type transport system ATP-binding protein